VHLTPWDPGSNLAVRMNRAIDDRPGIQQKAICYQWFKQRLILCVSKPSISQWSQIKEDTIEPSVPAREFNLKACTAITWNNDQTSLGLEPRLADYCSQAVRTTTLPTKPHRQACNRHYHHDFLASSIILVSAHQQNIRLTSVILAKTFQVHTVILQYNTPLVQLFGVAAESLWMLQ